MRAVLQVVTRAKVTVDGQVVGEIGPGLMILLGVHAEDTSAQAAALADKVAGLRIFPDQNGKLNLSILDTGGGALVVSQFTLWADSKKGRRPSYTRAAGGQHAEPLYEQFTRHLAAKGIKTATGRFGAMMDVSLTNSGPLTLLVDTEKVF